jgi:hypothetical protein
MRVIVEASVTATRRGGVLARCERLRLAGGGRSQAEAVASLRRGVAAWCAGLERQHALDDALERRGVRWVDDGDRLTVEVACRELGR